MATTYTHIGKNKWKSFFLIGFFVVLIIAIGALFGWIYPEWQIVAPTLAVLFVVPSALVSYFSSDKIALALNGAKPLAEEDSLQAKKIHNMVENLSITAGLPKPKVYIIDDPSPNAFATGRNPEHGSIALTTGLIEKLEKAELEGVIAHELSHVGNYDILFGTIVVVLVGLIAYMSHFILRANFLGRRSSNSNHGNAGAILVIIGLVLAILAPLIAQLIKFAVSRKREYMADASGALLTRYPEGLAGALEKISAYPEPMRRTNSATMHLYLAGAKGKKGEKTFRLFSTHPPIEERIKRLREMGN
ncbi:M48 family metallopeptidase [Patescibacteria group bacterium]